MDALEHIDTAGMAVAPTVYAEAVDIEVGYCVFVHFVLLGLSVCIILYPDRSSNCFCVFGLQFGFALNQFPSLFKSPPHADRHGDLAVIHVCMLLSTAAGSL